MCQNIIQNDANYVFNNRKHQKEKLIHKFLLGSPKLSSYQLFQLKIFYTW
jgi:hypothetical protein